jgi:arginine decarboxylase-like protein
MKQSAVEYLVEILNNINNDFNSSFKEEIEQAKEIEKRQIVDSYVQGSISLTSKTEAEQYYKETFKTK